jgi:hypothetical protein
MKETIQHSSSSLPDPKGCSYSSHDLRNRECTQLPPFHRVDIPSIKVQMKKKTQGSAVECDLLQIKVNGLLSIPEHKKLIHEYISSSDIHQMSVIVKMRTMPSTLLAYSVLSRSNLFYASLVNNSGIMIKKDDR